MRMMFSNRMVAEKQFESYCKEHNATNSAGNFLAWLLSTDDGNKLVFDLYHDIIFDMLDGITRCAKSAGK